MKFSFRGAAAVEIDLRNSSWFAVARLAQPQAQEPTPRKSKTATHDMRQGPRPSAKSKTEHRTPNTENRRIDHHHMKTYVGLRRHTLSMLSEPGAERGRRRGWRLRRPVQLGALLLSVSPQGNDWLPGLANPFKLRPRGWFGRI